MNLSRKDTQIVSVFLIMFGTFFMVATQHYSFGVSLTIFAVWTMMMSESVLLSKVEHEMRSALEALSMQKEKEVEQVLCFLKESSIGASPFQSIEGAKKLCERMFVPSMVITPNHQIILANRSMHETLEWKDSSLNGLHAHTINDPLMMSKVGEYATLPANVNKQSITTNYVFISQTGKKLSGIMHASKIDVQGFFVIFYPNDDMVIPHETTEHADKNEN